MKIRPCPGMLYVTSYREGIIIYILACITYDYIFTSFCETHIPTDHYHIIFICIHDIPKIDIGTKTDIPTVHIFILYALCVIFVGIRVIHCLFGF